MAEADRKRSAELDSISPEARLGRVLRALDHGFFQLEKGRVARVNPGLSRISGFSEEALVGMRPSELLAGADGRPLSEPGSPEAIRLRDVSGDLVPVSLRAVDEDCYLVVDRSRETRLEREVWRLAQDRRAARGESGVLELPPDEFFGMIEHEIRTASTVIRGYNRMLLDERVGSLNECQTGFLHEMRRATERISELLDNLLEMASHDCPSGLRVTRRPASLHRVARAAADAVRPVLEDRAMQLELDLQADPEEAFIDPARIEQVLLNLLTNAAKFAPRASRIRLESRSRNGTIELMVRDCGAGVEPGEAERIFEPFVQGAAASATAAGGVGLGLAICRKILHAHGGAIRAECEESGGVFRVTIPSDH
ncbi:MAG: ATP-binding protein [Myxococcota bacterium]